MEILAGWAQFKRIERGALVHTSCLMPSGAQVVVSVIPSMDGWVVSDEGAAIYEARGRGLNVEAKIRGLKSKLAKSGLKYDQGKIYSPRARTGDLPYMVAYVATEALDAARWLVQKSESEKLETVKDTLPILLRKEFPSLIINKPLTVYGKSQRQYKFGTVLSFEKKGKLILDPVARNDYSINNRVVANLDVRAANYPNLMQRLVFDDGQKWSSADLSLLSVGADAVPLSETVDFVKKMAA